MNFFKILYKPIVKYISEKITSLPFSKFLDTLFSYFSCTGIINTKVGIKPLNQIIASDWLNDLVINSVTGLKFDQFITTPDFLKDQYTLIGRTITEWPHYELIRYLDNNLLLDSCDYIKRCKNGTLDFRKKMKISKSFLKEKYREKLSAMKNGEVFSIKVFLAYDNTYVVADGKHSLAMAFYFDYRSLKFEVIRNLLFDIYKRWIFEKINNNEDFTKHNDFFRRACEYRKKENDRIS